MPNPTKDNITGWGVVDFSLDGTTPPQECTPGSIKFTEFCQDGSWHIRQVCDVSGHWGPIETRECPVTPPPTGKAKARIVVKINGDPVSDGIYDAQAVVEIIAEPLSG